MIDIDWNPNAQKLRQFAIASVVGFPLIALLLRKLLPLVNVNPPSNIVMIGLILGGPGCIIRQLTPRLALPFYWMLITLTFPIGLAIGWIALPLIYLGLFTPIAIGLKVLGKDPMTRDAGDRSSHWIKRKPMPPAVQYYKQY